MVLAMLNPTVKKTSVLLSEFLFTEKGKITWILLIPYITIV